MEQMLNIKIAAYVKEEFCPLTIYRNSINNN
jgi:hypothetical protein